MRCVLLLLFFTLLVSSKIEVKKSQNEVKTLDDDEKDPDLPTCARCKLVVTYLKMINYEALTKKNKEELQKTIIEKCKNPLIGILFRKPCTEIKRGGPLLDVIFNALRQSLTEVYESLRPVMKCPSFEKLKSCDEPTDDKLAHGSK